MLILQAYQLNQFYKTEGAPILSVPCTTFLSQDGDLTSPQPPTRRVNIKCHFREATPSLLVNEKRKTSTLVFFWNNRASYEEPLPCFCPRGSPLGSTPIQEPRAPLYRGQQSCTGYRSPLLRPEGARGSSFYDRPRSYPHCSQKRPVSSV